jgi:hypothetical protein
MKPNGKCPAGKARVRRPKETEEQRRTRDFALINELLPSSTANGAYLMGFVTVLAWQGGYALDRVLLKHVRDSATLDRALYHYRLWKAGKRSKR